MNTAGLNQTPSAMRIHIGVFGRVNHGKSSLINAITGQQVSLVSPVEGTTTDPVSKTMEIYPLGPCVFIDTAGFSDESTLGLLRTEKTKEVIQKTDIAILVLSSQQEEFELEKEWLKYWENANIPVMGVLNKADLISEPESKVKAVKSILGIDCIPVSAEKNQGIGQVKSGLVEMAPKDFELDSIAGHLVKEGDHVLLVMPQDIQAPKGRLILPQVQSIRDLLDNKVIVTSVTTDKMTQALAMLKEPPHLIITDSKDFGYVYKNKPQDSKLTSFSALMARYKGDIDEFLKGVNVLDTLTEKDRILIAEACTHDPLDGDIGRVKIPSLLREKFGPDIPIEIVNGKSFPRDLSPYSLIIHCGGCMFNRRYMLGRIQRAKQQNIPITNYGIFLGKMNGILPYIIV